VSLGFVLIPPNQHHLALRLQESSSHGTTEVARTADDDGYLPFKVKQIPEKFLSC
jgi:hypothetical protein